MSLLNPTLPQRRNERFRRLLAADPNWTLDSGPDLTLFYDFARNVTLDAVIRPSTGLRAGPTLGFIRTTKARFNDYDNVLRTVRPAEARFTGCRRVENSCLQSEDFDTTWVDVGVTTTANQATNPVNGTLNADLIDSGTADDDIRRHSRQTAIDTSVYGAGAQLTVSCYVKGVTGDHNVVLLEGGDAVWHGVTFDLDNGIVDDGVIHDVDAQGIIDVGDGWFRCWFQYTSTNGADIALYLGATPDEINNSGPEATFNPNTVGQQSAYFWGAQVELTSGQADPAPSEYIPTTTVRLARTFATKRRTNLILQSNDLSTTWANTRSTDAQSAGTDPKNGSAANSISEDGTAANTHYIQQAITLHTAGTYAWSVYFKASNRSWVAMRPASFGSGALYSYFDLANGLTGVVASAVDSTSIEDAGNGWYRCTVVWTETSADLVGVLQIVIAEADNDITFNGLSRVSILSFGAQLEKGSSATAYIPTTTAVESSGFNTAISPTGLLIEEARTNICLQSEDFGTTWSETNARDNADTLNTAIAPNGILSADKLIDDSGGGTGEVIYNQSLTIALSTVFTYSCYAKKDQLDQVLLLQGSTGISAQIYFNLVTGTVGTIAGDVISGAIEDVGNGWFRCSMVFTSSASDSSGQLRLYAATGNSTTVNLNGTSSIFIWGAQLEVGAFPTSYIPTVASSVTRNADAITTTDVGWYNKDAGTLYFSAEQFHGTPITDYIGLHNGTFQESHYIYSSDGTNVVANSRVGNVNQYNLNPLITTSVGTNFKAALAFALNDAKFYADGDAGVPDTSLLVPTITELSMGADLPSFGGAKRSYHLAQVRYYNGAARPQELENLSDGLLEPVQL